MAFRDLILDEYRKRYIYQYLFLIIIVFVGVPLVFGPFTTNGFWLNLIVIHICFAFLIERKEKERLESIRKKKLREITRGRR
jgi:hypothetical protein